MDLPTELRLEIFKFALTDGASKPTATLYVRRNHTRAFFQSDCIGLKPQVALLRTCTQINQEATPILYGNYNFVFMEGTTLRRFLSCIESQVPLLRHIEIREDRLCDSVYIALRACTGLRRLRMSVYNDNTPISGERNDATDIMLKLIPVYYMLSRREGSTKRACDVVQFQISDMIDLRISDVSMPAEQTQAIGPTTLLRCGCTCHSSAHTDIKRSVNQMWARIEDKLEVLNKWATVTL